MAQDELARNNRRLIGRLGLVVVVMFGFGFAMVPLYDVFCEVTGLNGKTGRIATEEALSQQVDTGREVEIVFAASVKTDLPWDVRPMTRKIRVHPGELTEVKFWAQNNTNQAVTGQAVPSVTPMVASKYFNKTECFCFTKQLLQPGEGKEMPLRFVVETGLPEDENSLTLSYSFFRMDESGAPQPGDGLEQITLGPDKAGADTDVKQIN